MAWITGAFGDLINLKLVFQVEKEVEEQPTVQCWEGGKTIPRRVNVVAWVFGGHNISNVKLLHNVLDEQADEFIYQLKVCLQNTEGFITIHPIK